MSPAIITLLVLAVMVVFFVTEKLPLGLVSMAGAILLACLGIITKADVFSAFSGSTIALLAGMMIIGQGLFQTGLADKMAHALVKVTGTSENGIMIASILVGLVLSSICSGVGVVAMMLPIVIAMSMDAKVSVSRQLIPLSFAASIGCNLTLVGAASNVSVSGLIEDMGVDFLSFFELGKIGLPLCVLFLIYFLTIGKKLLTPGDSSDPEYLKEYTKRESAGQFNPVKASVCAVILVAVLIAMAVANKEWPMYFIAAIGCVLMLATGCISEKDAMKAVDWPTLFIVGGMSAVSKAMASSGAGDLIANAVLKVMGETPNKLLFLFLVLLVTMILTNMMMNTSTVVLVTPLFVPVAMTLGINPVAIGVAICVAASAPSLTPVGSGTNTLIIRPGNLGFRDFFVPGIGLSVLTLVGCMAMIPIFWPL
ncbi:SLC13/DASS family transporter [Oscillibacter valericigenes]|uniref:SLC13 family permease n=1 Tax=Oscillibacter valericigenes TaxID=351091 RepID=UPI001F19F9E1|nr:SLC13 family permease [Oscillibacter valericigenes]MCF2665184.1 SLC13/DASS family transporter [Oscillibacter valericigenes]